MVKKLKHDVSLEDFIYRHSPLKSDMKIVLDENKPVTNYNKIINKLYLGNSLAAKDKDFFKQKNIKAVLNCSHEIPNHFRCDANIEYLRIPVDDGLRESDFRKMTKLLPVAAEFIHKHIDILKQNIFINCRMGRQRSSSCVAAYLMKYHDLTAKQACKLILEKRPEAFHFGKSLNFSKSLNEYEEILRKCK